jgi:hypothetical protein
MTISKLDYCQYLLSTQINYTLTNFANHAQKMGAVQYIKLLEEMALAISEGELDDILKI